MPEMNYVARKKFKSDGKLYKPGDIWEPTGGKFDDAVIRHYVTVQEVQPKPKRTRSKKTSGTSSK